MPKAGSPVLRVRTVPTGCNAGLCPCLQATWPMLGAGVCCACAMPAPTCHSSTHLSPFLFAGNLADASELLDQPPCYTLQVVTCSTCWPCPHLQATWQSLQASC